MLWRPKSFSDVYVRDENPGAFSLSKCPFWHAKNSEQGHRAERQQLHQQQLSVSLICLFAHELSV